MGSCLSKKSSCASSSPLPLPNPPDKLKSEPQSEKKEENNNLVKKEVFIIKHRKSHEIERQISPSDEEKGEAQKAEEIAEKGKTVISAGGPDCTPVRTSSCTKEEVDAILIQCGRLSRSSSTGKPNLSSGRKYSGSKRSFDFDAEIGKAAPDDDDAVADERDDRRRRHSHGRRRTPSREREQQHRSGSRERGGSGGGGRRVSRSPGRRSESPITTTANSNSSNGGNANCSKPGKLVSVPATITSSLGMEKSSNGEGNNGGVKRIQVKRNVSPRARSPARGRGSGENQNVTSLSRSNSRKAEHSPYRRNPLAEIDNNIISQAPPIQKPNADNKIVVQVAENKININNLTTNVNCKSHDQIALNVIPSCPENPKNQPITRTRSSRLSRDLDVNPETPTNPNTSSYTALLLEDIQNFHQKNTPPPPTFTLPPCVTKAHSILEAVADLNSSTGSNLSNPMTNCVKKTKQEVIKDHPILESEIVANDDLMEPSFHKYVTVRRGATSGDEDDLEEQESSGSNSFAGSQKHWVSSSGWEPNSAESTDRWTMSSSSSSRAVNRQNGIGRGRVANRSSSYMAPGAANGST